MTQGLIKAMALSSMVIIARAKTIFGLLAMSPWQPKAILKAHHRIVHHAQMSAEIAAAVMMGQPQNLKCHGSGQNNMTRNCNQQAWCQEAHTIARQGA